MNAVEEIEAAIKKLTAERDASTPAPWALGFRGNVETIAPIEDDRFDWMAETIARVELLEEDGDLIVTLHRTIDAQLAVLGSGLSAYKHFGERNACNALDEHKAALALAGAINGTA